jgi:hypothetical protein
MKPGEDLFALQLGRRDDQLIGVGEMPEDGAPGHIGPVGDRVHRRHLTCLANQVEQCPCDRRAATLTADAPTVDNRLFVRAFQQKNAPNIDIRNAKTLRIPRGYSSHLNLFYSHTGGT